MSTRSDDDRRLPRCPYVLPCLLRDPVTQIHVKCVVLDLNELGCRVFTNDNRIRLMEPSRLIGRIFEIELTLDGLDLTGVVGRVRNVHPGANPDERQIGLELEALDPVSKGHIRAFVAQAIEGKAHRRVDD